MITTEDGETMMTDSMNTTLPPTGATKEALMEYVRNMPDGEAHDALIMARAMLERDKADAAAKAEPVQADTITIDRMESIGIWADMLNIRDTAKGASKILANGPADADNYQIITGMVELMAEKLDALCDRHDRATSGATKAA